MIAPNFHLYVGRADLLLRGTNNGISLDLRRTLQILTMLHNGCVFYVKNIVCMHVICDILYSFIISYVFMKRVIVILILFYSQEIC